MDLGLKGKRVLITGGSEGIGFGIAENLLSEGAGVVLASRSIEKLDSAKKKLAGIGEAETQVLDLTHADLVEQAVTAVLRRGPVDIFINSGGGPSVGEPSQLPMEAWDEGYQSLLRSLIAITKLVLPGMRQRKWGRILTITSTAAQQLLPGLVISAVFRAGISAWAKALALEVGKEGILVNNLLPGPTQTSRITSLMQTNEAFFKSMQSRGALGRMADPAEIARVATFLCSAANTYVTGTDVLADGGSTTSF